MKIEINNLSNEDVKELNEIFNSWKKIKSTSNISRWQSFFVNVDIDNQLKEKNTQIKISDE